MRTAVRFVVERDRAHGEVRATATDAARLPTGFVTLMMTDIEGSTGLLQALGDRHAQALNGVRAVLRAAVAAQRALRARRWPAGVRVGVRIGIHSGRPTLTDAGYIGLAVHTTARVCAAAHGGQVVLSGEARAAVGLAPPRGSWVHSLGRYRLPGLRVAETPFQVTARGLSGRFPPPAVGRGQRARA